MARDLLIHGINKNDFTNNLRTKFIEWSLSNEELTEFLRAFKHRISISNKIILEDYLYKKKQLTIEEQHKNLGIKELVSYRSKQVCFAIAQLVSYYNDEVFTQLTDKIQIETLNGCLILNKDAILGLLNWLIAVCRELNFEYKEQYQIRFPKELKQLAEKFVQKKFSTGSEFDFYGDELFNIINWKQKIKKTDFDFYYWEDSN